jgi:hypothetical protein
MNQKVTEISNERKRQLAYCKVCEYRDFDNTKGITCALTKNVADFENECPSMRVDFEELEWHQIDLHNKIIAYIRKNYDLLLVKKENYILPNHPFYSKYYSKENTQKIKIKESSYESEWTSGAFFVLIVLIITIVSIENNGYKVLFGFFAFITFCFLIVRAIMDYYTPRKIHFSTDKLGFVIDDKRFFWHDIVDFRIMYRGGKKGYHNLIIGTINEGVQAFEIKDIKITTDQLLEIFSFNRLDHLTRYDRNLPDLI